MFSRLVKIKALIQSEIGNLFGIDICRNVFYNRCTTKRKALIFSVSADVKNISELRIAVKVMKADGKKRILPAYPLFVKDPYFSIWSAGDELNKSDTCFWQGDEKPLYGIVVADGVKYCFMGVRSDCTAMEQIDLSVSAFSTAYVFSTDSFDLRAEFISPLLLDDIELLSCPVCYLKYTVTPKTEIKKLSVALMVNDKICYNKKSAPHIDTGIRGDALALDGFECAYFGLDRQNILSLSADNVSADWGYYFVAGRECFYHSLEETDAVLLGGELSESLTGTDRFITAVNSYEGLAGEVQDKFLIAFDDVCSIFYYGQLLKGYWFRDGKTIINALEESYYGFDKAVAKCAAFEKEFAERMSKYGGEYLKLCYASLRQSIAAHKAVADKKGRLLFLSKECSSDGCIATVDVTYASMPLYLLYNPKLVAGMIYPIFDFARMPVWKEDFAPHDAGVYPYCQGQYYAVTAKPSGKFGRQLHYINGADNGVLPFYYQYPARSDIYLFEKQMPVEECANMLIITALVYRQTGDKQLVTENYDLLEKWAGYLVNKGFIPENQLCTDDFAGHMDKNVNLSVKATVALYAFKILSEAAGKPDTAAFYEKIAGDRASRLQKLFPKHMPLSFDSGEDTYSLKYNLAADKMLGAGLFDQKLLEREVDLYISKLNVFGCPLDNRKSFTKSDWLMWVAALTEDGEKRGKLIKPLSKFLTDSPGRIPYSDWYDTVTGEVPMFRNRTVQGGLYALPLIDKK